MNDTLRYVGIADVTNAESRGVCLQRLQLCRAFQIGYRHAVAEHVTPRRGRQIMVRDCKR